MRIFLLLTLLLTLLPTLAHAREPDVVPHDYSYNYTVGGSEDWKFADTFVLGGMIVMTVMIMMLPRIFDGKSQGWPVQKFAMFNLIEQHRILYKFPTRRLCGSY